MVHEAGSGGVLTLPSPYRDAAALSAAAAHQYLALVPLLAAMPALERRSLCGRLHVSRFEKAEPLVRQGSDNTGELYILLTGEALFPGEEVWELGDQVLGPGLGRKCAFLK